MLDFLFRNKKNKNKQEIVNKINNTTMDDASEFVLKTFLKLTSNTYPYGFEEYLVDEMMKLKMFPSDIQKDAYGNYFYKIGNSRTMFTSHLDTSCRDYKPVKHIFQKHLIKTNGTTILGADDKAGMTIMLYMMKNKIPGLYYFFIGEEVGCVGSGLAAKHLAFKADYDRCVSFDRRGTDSVITHQSSSRCCSDEFGKQLATELNKTGFTYKIDDSGVYTDSAEFTSEIAECTNISVGYYKEHTTEESQDIEHLSELAKACLLVDWESLVTKRDPSKTEYKSWDYSTSYSSYASTYRKSTYRGGSGGGNWRDRDHGYGWGSNFRNIDKAYGYDDDFYEDDETKKTRRGKNKKDKKDKKGTIYYDNGNGELIPFNDKLSREASELEFFNECSSSSGSDKFDWIKFKFLDDNLTMDELEVIKNQYLDMHDEEERRFYGIMKSYVTQLR